MVNDELENTRIKNLKKGIKSLEKIKDRASNRPGHFQFIEAVHNVNHGMSQIIDDYEQKKIDFRQLNAQIESFVEAHIEDYHIIAKTIDLPNIVKKILNKIKLKSIETQLANLLIKINEYKNLTGSEEYELAYHAAKNIYNGLNALLIEKKSNSCDLEKFKTQALDFLNSEHVKDDIKTLDTPRGWKAKTIVSNIVIALTTLIVGYPLFLLLNKGFFKPSTDSGFIVNELNRAYSALAL